MKNLKFLPLLAICALVLFSCKDDTDSCEFSTTTLSGKIEGNDWTFQGGSATNSNGELDVDLFGMDEDLTNGPCGIFFGSSLTAFFSIPAEVGQYPLDFSFTSGGQTVTLFDPSTANNIIVSDGCVEIVSITDTEAVLRFNIENDGNNFLRGEATLTIC